MGKGKGELLGYWPYTPSTIPLRGKEEEVPLLS